MLSLIVGTAAFQAGQPLAASRRSNAVSMVGAPTDFPVKNVWTTVCSAKDLKPATLTAAFGAGQDILIATDSGGKIFATANICPHIGTPLDQGTLRATRSCARCTVPRS